MRRDTFTRTLASGWGTADTGGAWTADSGTGDFSVNGSTGRIRLARRRREPRDLPRRHRGRLGRLDERHARQGAGGGGSAWLYHELRRSSSNTNSYRLLARFAGDGTTSLTASRVVNGAEVAIGSAVAVPSVNYLTGFTLRGQVTGTNPTTIRIKAWTGTEPSTWQYTATDSAGPQVAGRAGLRSYTSGSTTNAPLTLTIDNYSANATATPPPPPPRPRLRFRHRPRRFHRPPALAPAAASPPGRRRHVRGRGRHRLLGQRTTRPPRALLDGIPGTVFTLGDNVYPNGTAAEYIAYYDADLGPPQEPHHPGRSATTNTTRAARRGTSPTSEPPRAIRPRATTRPTSARGTSSC